MNKKFANFFTSNYGMVVGDKFARGTIHGYETNATVVMFDNVSPVRIHVSFYSTDEQKRTIEAAIRKLAITHFQMSFTQYGLFLGFNAFTVKGLLKKLPDYLENIFGILEENGALKADFCPVCGNPLTEENSTERNIDGAKIRIDNDCVDTINSVISAENAEFESAPNNYLKGFAGAVIGGLVGVAISTILYIVGFVSSISAIVAIVLGCFLYQKFHGKPNKMMLVIVTLTTLVMLAGSIPVIYIVVSGIAANEAGVDMSAIDAFNKLMSESEEFARFFYADLAMVVLFSAIGAGLQAFAMAKKIKRQKNI